MSTAHLPILRTSAAAHYGDGTLEMHYTLRHTTGDTATFYMLRDHLEESPYNVVAVCEECHMLSARLATMSEEDTEREGVAEAARWLREHTDHAGPSAVLSGELGYYWRCEACGLDQTGDAVIYSPID